MPLTLILALVALLVASVAAWWVYERWCWRLVASHRVLVHVKGQTLAGIVVSRRGRLLFLADAAVSTAAGGQPIDGLVVVERPQIEWIQVVS